MFWADQLVKEIEVKYKDKINFKKALIIRDEKTASGRIHVGSLRGVAIHGLISEILEENGINNEFLYEINDFDIMDNVPAYLDKERFSPFLGKLLCFVPSPDGNAKNYAEYFAEEFINVIKKTGFKLKYYRSSDLYKSGKYNEAIKITIKNADKIREIYKRISGAEKELGWLPIQIICEKCGKLSTTKATSFDGERVKYVCEKNFVEWTNGCGHKGEISPFDGNSKLPWKVEWAAKFSVLGIDIEGAGKDHSTKGGAREVADAISREVFNHEPPFNIPYEFFHIAGKKMSSSKGIGVSLKEISDLLQPEILRFLMINKEPKRVIDFVPDGDTVPVLYDSYDEMAGHYFENIKDDYARIFFLSHGPLERKRIEKRFLPRFLQISFLVQMPHIDTNKEIEKIKNDKLTDLDKEEIEKRTYYADYWIKNYAPEKYKYQLQENIPETAKKLNVHQKEALRLILDYIKSQNILDGKLLHEKIHEIKESSDIKPQEIFSAIYASFLNKENGPKAGWFLSVLNRDFLEKRLEEVIK